VDIVTNGPDEAKQDKDIALPVLSPILTRKKSLADEIAALIKPATFSEGKAVQIREIARRTGRDRKTVQRAVRASEPPRYRREPAGSKLDPAKEEIHRLLRGDQRMPGTRVRELIAELGFGASKTLVDNYLREVRQLYLPRRTYQRTLYRPGESCQFDLFEPKSPVPVGYGQSRRATTGHEWRNPSPT